ncbi:ionotropic receptor 93a-like [Penaeus indicus]|uniref:ionotropic receptor 93a-like n=1 Tax=Penaeus indicus TaxID=29960 RepID=UPI00300CEDA0
MRMAWDDQWGTLNEGVWTGMVGTLEQERADFSLMLFWSHARKQSIDFTRIYAYEPFVMITHKPRPLPQHTALVRPFRVELWGAILAATFVLAVSLWAIQRAWSSFSGGRSLNINTAFLHAWAILLEDPPPRLPSNVTGQMLVGWWWVFCFLMTAIYRSYLIAHLSVPITPAPIDNLGQLLALPGATWGIEPGFGLGWDWFKLNTNAKVQDMFKELEVLNIEAQLDRVLDGRHAFFTWKYYIKTIIASRYTNRYGYTPIHLGRQEFIPGSCGWGVRKGAPFLSAIDRIKDRLAEAGLIDYWLYVLFESKMKKERAQRWSQKPSESADEDDPAYVTNEVNAGGIVLNLNHLQGAFYLLFLGYGAGLIALLAETFMNRSFSESAKHWRK